MVDKPSSKLSVVLEIKSLRSHTSDGRQKIGVRICFSVNTGNSMCIVSLRSCPLPISSLCLSREESMIHLFIGSHVKKPESGLFSDWI